RRRSAWRRILTGSRRPGPGRPGAQAAASGRIHCRITNFRDVCGRGGRAPWWSPRMSHLSKFLLPLLLMVAAPAVAGPEQDARAREAVRVLGEIQKIPEQSIPDKLLDEAKAVVVIPDTIKAGLVIGGRRGHGLMSVKTPDGTWSNPVFVTLTGGSIGFQAGVQSSDIVLVFRNDRSLDNVVNGKFTLGADAAV